MRPVHIPGHGFIDQRGRYYTEANVAAAVQHICDWWASLPPEARDQLSHLAHLATIDREIDAAVFGD